MIAVRLRGMSQILMIFLWFAESSVNGSACAVNKLPDGLSACAVNKLPRWSVGLCSGQILLPRPGLASDQARWTTINLAPP